MNDNLENLPPHKRPNQLRACFTGVLTEEEAQTKIGPKYRVLELRPAGRSAQGFADNMRDKLDQLDPATEVIFELV